MTEYIPKSLEMDRATYMRTLWTIRDYEHLREIAEACIAGTPDQTETPEIQRQRDITATERTNIRYAEAMRVIRAIEEALTEAVYPEAREAVWDHIQFGRRWPLDRSDRSYSRIKHAYIYAVAKKLHYI